MLILLDKGRENKKITRLGLGVIMVIREKKYLHHNRKLLGAGRKAVNINTGSSLLFCLRRALINQNNWYANLKMIYEGVFTYEKMREIGTT